MLSIDLNCDLGEGCGNDERLMPLITSANIACGFHAGDNETMKRTVDLAVKHSVAIGAHPGYPDRDNFGRTNMPFSSEQIGAIVTEQIEKLEVICSAAGTAISHVKPHGALYNQAAREPSVARAIANAVKQFDDNVVLFGLSGSHSIAEARRAGLRTASEVFADRTYTNDGSLTPRGDPRALIVDVNLAVSQVLDMVRDGRVRAVDGIMVAIKAETLCIHGDGARAVEFASTIRDALSANSIEIRRIKNG